LSYPIGSYHCKLDAKGRLMLPADCKDQLGELAEQGFVLRPGLFNKCLELYTMNDWLLNQSKLKSLNQFVKSNVEFIRKYNAGAKQVKLDSTGRILIPKNLIADGGLNKEVILTSLTDNMELWDKDTYQAEINRFDADEFGKLATEKLGNINDNS
jgi:MraZ protein